MYPYLVSLVLRYFVILVLLTAAGLKAYQLATTPVLGEGLLHARWFNVLIVEFELLFALWLCFGQLPKLTRLASITLFSIFAAVSFYKAVSGESSCGCFGNVSINPWYTMTLDLGIVLVLVLCRPEEQRAFSFRKIIIAGSVWLGIALPLLLFLQPDEVADFGDLGTITAENNGRKTIALMPKRWIDKPLPFLPYLKSESGNPGVLMNGAWTVVLYRANCPKCNRLLSALSAKEIQNVVSIEVPLSGRIGGKLNYEYSMYLDNGHDWFCAPPIVALAKDGIITEVLTKESQIGSYLSSLRDK
jgi:hypothetical protein